MKFFGKKEETQAMRLHEQVRLEVITGIKDFILVISAQDSSNEMLEFFSNETPKVLLEELILKLENGLKENLSEKFAFDNFDLDFGRRFLRSVRKNLEITKNFKKNYANFENSKKLENKKYAKILKNFIKADVSYGGLNQEQAFYLSEQILSSLKELNQIIDEYQKVEENVF